MVLVQSRNGLTWKYIVYAFQALLIGPAGGEDAMFKDPAVVTRDVTGNKVAEK